MEIEELFNQGKLSVRSYNVCKSNELDTVAELKEFYQNYKSFDKLKNCGQKSNDELLGIINNFKEIHEELTNLQQDSYSLRTIVKNLSRIQREVLNSFILLNTNKLSVRPKNAINLYLNGNFKILYFAEKIFLSNEFNINKIKNIGAKYLPELDIYLEIVKEFIFKVNDTKDERQLTILKNTYLIQKTFPLYSIPTRILELESIFGLTNFLISKNSFFDKNETIILKNSYKLYNESEGRTLDETANEVNLTRERVRQKRKSILDEIFEKLIFLRNFDDNLLLNYNLDTSKDFLDLDENEMLLINEFSETNFSKFFLTVILSVYLKDEYSILGNMEDVLFYHSFKSKFRHNWNNLYLIKSEILKDFDFINFIEDISSRLNDKIEETYSFNFKSYLASFLLNDKYAVIQKVEPIAELLIEREYNLLLDFDGNLKFERTTLKTLPEFIFETLEELDKPSTIEQIFTVLNSKYPGISKNMESLRGSCQKSRDLIYFGRSSTYGLKKWEKEKIDIKGGTIKDIVLEYISARDEPVHISEILNEVHKYREDTNAKNVITNLKLDPQKQYVIFNQNFIGLKTKSYFSNLTDLPKFLGKSITHYLKTEDDIHLEDVIDHFSEKLSISKKNAEYIISNLIENNFVTIDNEQMLRV